METHQPSQHALQEFRVPVNIKLSALWTSLMFLYIYVDYFHLYMPGKTQEILAGRVFEFQISQVFLFSALALVAIPALMIFLSLALPARTNRKTNLILALFYIPFSLFNLVGDAWPHMVLGAGMEVVLLGLVIRYAKKWPMA